MTNNEHIIERLEKINPTKIIIWTLLFLGGIVMITPIIFMISTSFKTGQEVYLFSLLPKKVTLDNYIFVLTESKFIFWALNSLWVATFSTLSVLFFDSLVGYTLAKYNFRGREIVFVAILSTLMIPTEMLIIPWYMMSREFGWIDTYWGIAFPGLMTGFGTFLMRQFFMSLPDELIEAAMKIAREIASKSPPAILLAKHALNTIEEMSLPGSYRFEQNMTVEVSKTEDAAEATRALLEKREPVFKGR